MTANSGPIRRDRASEPSEQRRSERQRSGRCIDCEQPSRTQRCPKCRERVEAATERYGGQQKRGRMARWQEDLGELVRAMDAITNAHKAIAAIGERTDLTARERQHMLVEPLAQVNLGRRFLIEVLRRNGELDEDDAVDEALEPAAGSSRSRDPNYAVRIEARRLAGLCDRCDCERMPGRKLCRKHTRKQRAVQRRYDARKRADSYQGSYQAPTTTKIRTGFVRGIEKRPRRRRS